MKDNRFGRFFDENSDMFKPSYLVQALVGTVETMYWRWSSVSCLGVVEKNTIDCNFEVTICCTEGSNEGRPIKHVLLESFEFAWLLVPRCLPYFKQNL